MSAGTVLVYRPVFAPGGYVDPLLSASVGVVELLPDRQARPGHVWVAGRVGPVEVRTDEVWIEDKVEPVRHADAELEPACGSDEQPVRLVLVDEKRVTCQACLDLLALVQEPLLP